MGEIVYMRDPLLTNSPMFSHLTQDPFFRPALWLPHPASTASADFPFTSIRKKKERKQEEGKKFCPELGDK